MRNGIFSLFLVAVVISLAACGQQADGGKPQTERSGSAPSAPPASTP
jgi:predicted small lipoprotein YifL